MKTVEDVRAVQQELRDTLYNNKLETLTECIYEYAKKNYTLNTYFVQERLDANVIKGLEKNGFKVEECFGHRNLCKFFYSTKITW